MTGKFRREALRLLRPQFPLKFVGISLFMTLFFWAYFTALEHPIHAVTLMPTTAFDRLIPFQAWSIPVYCTLWVYVVLPPSVLTTRPELLRYGAAATALALAGLAIFVLWPTTVTLQGTGFLKRIDQTGNACPSLHAAFAVFTAATLHRLLLRLDSPRWARAANVLWCVAILYSTLASKQHVVLDLAAGGALGALAARFALDQAELGRLRAAKL